jgi:hypothetical protein
MTTYMVDSVWRSRRMTRAVQRRGQRQGSRSRFQRSHADQVVGRRREQELPEFLFELGEPPPSRGVPSVQPFVGCAFVLNFKVRDIE